MSKTYYPRIIDETIEENLKAAGAVSIEGPQGCGKTTTAKRHVKSVLRMENTENIDNYVDLAEVLPLKLMEGEKPRLMDEWQRAPSLWASIKGEVDNPPVNGQFLMTSSTRLEESWIGDKTQRMTRISMFPMSLYESEESSGDIAILDLFDNPDMDIDGVESKLTLDELAFACCRGGWPKSLKQEYGESRLLVVNEYLDGLCTADNMSLDGVRRNPVKSWEVLKAYAKHASVEVKSFEIVKEVKEKFPDMTSQTVHRYMRALSRVFVLMRIPPFARNLRHPSTIRFSDKRRFIDPSIFAAVLELSPDDLIFDMDTFTMLFDNLAIRDLLVYTAQRGGRASHYSDRQGVDCDCIIHLENGDYAVFRIALTMGGIEDAAQSLLRFKKLLAKARKKRGIEIEDPKFMAVLNCGRFAYTRTDGVKVIPIGCLR